MCIEKICRWIILVFESLIRVALLPECQDLKTAKQEVIHTVSFSFSISVWPNKEAFEPSVGGDQVQPEWIR